jgi:ribosome-associated toxin RatA of RatAB toxin-antitoxin module
VKPISTVKTIVPESPESPDPIFDATVAFYPKFFDGCKSQTRVKEQSRKTTFLDLNLNMSAGCKELRCEAVSYFKKVKINTATFEENWRISP